MEREMFHRPMRSAIVPNMWRVSYSGPAVVAVMACSTPQATGGSDAAPHDVAIGATLATTGPEACPYTDPKVAAACLGCNPFEERLADALKLTGISADVRTDVKACLSGNTDVEAKSIPTIKASINGCLEKHTQLSEEYQKSLANALNLALSSVNIDAQKNWEDCRNSMRICNKPSCGTNVTRLDAAVPEPSTSSSPGAADEGGLVLFVGSGTVAGFLRCGAHMSTTSFTGRTRFAILSGGTVSGYNIVRESDSHGQRTLERMRLVGMSAGPPNWDHLHIKSATDDANYWLQVKISPNFPLTAVSTVSALQAIPQEPCSIRWLSSNDGPNGDGVTTSEYGGPENGRMTMCVRPKALAQLIRRPPALIKVLLPDANSGTHWAFDRLLWNGGRSPAIWQEPLNEFNGDYAELFGGNDVGRVALGMPEINSTIGARGLCTIPTDVRRLGICGEDVPAACEPKRLGLYLYFRAPQVSSVGQAKVGSDICDELRTIYSALGDEQGQAWTALACPFNAQKTRDGLQDITPE
jgi:hypothetical protein